MLTKAKITEIKSLGDKKSRLEQGCFVVEGQKMVEELVNSSFEILQIFSSEQDSFFFGVENISPKDMSRISQLKTPTNYLATVNLPQNELDFQEINNSLSLALDNIQDPGNLGTIIRLADWFGIKNIICSKTTVDCFSPKVVQASMGAIFRVKLHYVDIEELTSKLEVPIYGTFLEGENIYNADLQAKGVILMGNEGRGINDKLKAKVSHKLYIPPYPTEVPNSESLNVAVATAVICSEFRRRM